MNEQTVPSLTDQERNEKRIVLMLNGGEPCGMVLAESKGQAQKIAQRLTEGMPEAISEGYITIEIARAETVEEILATYGEDV